MKKIYCISGLGADERAFSRLHVDGYELVHLPWLLPIPNETIQEYAGRMSKNIVDENPVLMGLSFGGIMSIEIARQLPVEKVILISSVKSSKEIPAWMKLAGRLKLNKLMPMRSYKILEPIQNYNLGATTREEKEMARVFRENVSPVYLSWAINQVLNWKNDWQPASLYHIHGDADKLFPIKKIKANLVINNAGHLMVMNRSKEVNQFLSAILTASC
jgi:pimeloyl-ACP methyl ester carboxylesterase